MRQVAATLDTFYETRLGRAVSDRIAGRLSDLWGDCSGQNVLGLGYSQPVLTQWQGSAKTCVALQPEAVGTVSFKGKGGEASTISPEDRFPFAEGAFDRIVLLHALEEAEHPRAVLRETWRVLAPEGRIVIVAANRRSLWSLAESKAFGHGRPWTKRQLIRFAGDSLFQVTASATAVHVPPLNWPIITSAAAAWEGVGETVLSGLGGVVLVEAIKRLYAKPGGSAGAVVTDAVRAGKAATALPRNRAARKTSESVSNSSVDVD